MLSVILGICTVTLFPVHAGLLKHLREIRPGFSPAPFLEGSRTLSLFDFTQNILLFLPFGFLAAAGRPGAASRADLWKAVCLGFLLSTLIECAQTRIPGRFPSFWDIGFNTLGSALGALLISRLRSGAGRFSR